MTKKEFREIELLAMEGLKETAKTDPAKVPEILKSLKEAAPQSWLARFVAANLAIIVTLIISGTTLFFQEQEKKRTTEFDQRKYANEEKKRSEEFIEKHRATIFAGDDEEFKLAMMYYVAVTDEKIQKAFTDYLAQSRQLSAVRARILADATNSATSQKNVETLAKAMKGQPVSESLADPVPDPSIKPMGATAPATGAIPNVPVEKLTGTVYCQANSSLDEGVRKKISDQLAATGLTVPVWQVSDKLRMPDQFEVRFYRNQDKELVQRISEIVKVVIGKPVGVKQLRGVKSKSAVLELWAEK